jgi:deoxyribodipyrimidine photo-lyase
MFNRALFIFRRDFRLEDNSGLIFATQNSKVVIPCFIFTPEQIEHNPYRSDHCLQFMIESLRDLEEQLSEKKGKLYFFKGEAEKILEDCIKKLEIDALVINRDYTPYSRKRDEKLETVCKKHKISFSCFDDALLNPPEETVKKDQKPYTIFTPYFKNASKQEVNPPKPNRAHNYFQDSISFAEKNSILSKILPNPSLTPAFKGGRVEALKLLKKLKNKTDYSLLRDFPAQEGSSGLSPYLKFTVCSPREVYAAISDQLGSDHELIRSLYWRDFFTAITFFFPHVFTGSFHPKFDRIKWSYDKGSFQKWCEGKTGFPIIDAGMREMNQTGFMHNRVRMIAGSFLVKDLHIDWRWGDKYFAQTLIDYDPAVNNGNWQWVASTGCDAQPYFRIFNPWNQQKKFDPDCIYIKKWIPELRNIPSKIIHAWDDPKQRDDSCHYPKPLVTHETEAKKALTAYKNC